MNVSRALRTVLRVLVCLPLATAGAGFAATDWSPATLLTQPFDINTNILQVTPSIRWGLFRESDSITITTTNGSPIQIFDLNGNSVYSGNPTTLMLPRGHYIVECAGDRNQFCVLPDDYTGSPFLGTEVANTSDSAGSQRMTLIATTWVRAVQSVWANVETNRDAWDWSLMDAAVSNNPGRKIIAMSADFVPSWVGPDEIIPLHTAYVQALATRYKGKLAAIEIWNEPFNDKFPNTTNVESLVNFYLQMFSQAQKAIKAIDSKPQVIGPAWSSALELESIAMSTNKLATFDGWSWHDYSRGTYAPDVDYLSPYWIRSITKDHLIWNFGKLANLKSLFVDELGLYGHSALGSDLNTNIDTEFATTLDWYRGMCRAIKTTVMYHAAGVSCIISHVFPLGENLSDQNFELYGWDVGLRGPHPKTSAFLMTSYWLNGAKMGDARIIDNQVYLYTWKRPKIGTLVFAWCVEGQSRTITAPPGYHMTDIYGTEVNPTTLGEEPIIFRPIKSASPHKAADIVQAALGS